MPRADKSSYADKQKRQAEHIVACPKATLSRRAWATVKEETSGGKKTGAGRGKAS